MTSWRCPGKSCVLVGRIALTCSCYPHYPIARVFSLFFPTLLCSECRTLPQWKMPAAQQISLHSNKLSGSIPSSFIYSTSAAYFVLTLDQNNLSGPACISYMPPIHCAVLLARCVVALCRQGTRHGIWMEGIRSRRLTRPRSGILSYCRFAAVRPRPANISSGHPARKPKTVRRIAREPSLLACGFQRRLF